MRAILTYHSLDDSGSVISLAPAQFRRHVEWLANSDVRVRPLCALVDEARGDDSHIDNTSHAVALTFDDGFANFATMAAPVLRDHALPATVFVVPQRVGLDNRWHGSDDAVPSLPLLGWDDLAKLVESGIDIGAHTRSHPRLSALSADAIEDEIVGGAEDVRRHLGLAPSTFAYPYGAVNDTAAGIASRNFRVSCTTEFRSLRSTDSSARVPRLDSYYFRRPDQLEQWSSLRFRARLRVRGGIRRVRQLIYS